MNHQAVAAYDWLIRPTKRWMEIPILISFNLILVALAYVSINLPFSPVPITGQTFGVILISMILGRTRAVAVVSAYLAEGALGLPVLAGGKGGLVALMGPTGGYLFGFLAAAFIVGHLSDKGWHRTYVTSVVAMVVGTGAIFACGMFWLGVMVPESSLFMIGFWPFVPGALVKIAIAAVILPSVYRFFHER